MEPEIYFMPPMKEGLPTNPPHELLLTIAEILKKEGYELRYSTARSYALEQTKKGIFKDGIAFYANLVRLQEAVLPDNTPREDFIDLLRYMGRNIQASTELLITDPYLFPSNPDADYITHLGMVFRNAIERISRLEIVTKPDRNQVAEAAFLNEVKSIKADVKCRIKYTCIFHDRFWIADGKRGIFVGTSLNGIGRRYAIADYIREEDVKDIYARFQTLL